jgi:hypothetical protein
VAVDSFGEYRTTFLPRPSGAEDGGGRKEEGACLGLNTCQSCGWSKPRGVEPTCAHAARGPVILLSPPYERTKPLVPDIEGHDSAASVMPWWARRWANPICGDEPQESDNIQRARTLALAAAIRASGNPRIPAWGRHNDPVKGLMLVTGAVLDLQLDSASQWAWKRDHGVAWDDTERRGRIPAGRQVDAGVGNATDGNGLVDPAKYSTRAGAGTSSSPTPRRATSIWPAGRATAPAAWNVSTSRTTGTLSTRSTRTPIVAW